MLAAAAIIMTLVAQKNAISSVENLPLGARVGNALISYCRYLGKMFWPTDLAVYYPFQTWPLEQVLLAGAFLGGISVLTWMTRRRYPFLLTGWLWFLGTLVPVIGLVQVGGQAMADRYTYLPSLGILILIIWGAYELTRRWQYHVIVLSVAGSAAIVPSLAVTRRQIGYWKESETLFRHALEVTQNNFIAHNNLGTALASKGQIDEAIGQYREAIRIKPGYADPHNNLGNALDKQGQPDEAIRQYQEAIHLRPGDAVFQNNLANSLIKKGQFDEAIRHCREVLRRQPDYAQACNTLGTALGKKGQFDEAISQFQKALRLQPDYADSLQQPRHHPLREGPIRRGDQSDSESNPSPAGLRRSPHGPRRRPRQERSS